MKKTILYIFLVLLIIGCIGAAFKGFYEITSYYNWTDEAKSYKILRIQNTFSLEKSFGEITAKGEIMNRTDSNIIVQPKDIILVCKDNETSELHSFSNDLTYNLKPNVKTIIRFQIFNGNYITNGSKEAQRIIDNYQIIRIEYRVSENETIILKTIEQTGSNLVPLGTYIAVSIILIGLTIFIIVFLIKSTRKKKIAKHIINEIINSNVKIQPSKFISDRKEQISSIEFEINALNNEIINFNNNKVLSAISNVDSLDGWQFEKYCAKLFTTLGYQVTVTKGSGDFGADLILDNSISVQCKLYSGSVGLHALQEVYSSMARYKTKYAWVITNSTFTKQAKEYANDAQIKLIDRSSLKQLMSKAFSTYSEDYLKERQTKIADMQNKVYCLSSEIIKIEVLNDLSYKEIKALYKKYFKSF